jgi:hypothetical protein
MSVPLFQKRGIENKESVVVRKVKAVPAEKVVVNPLESIPSDVKERYIVDYLESIPLIFVITFGLVMIIGSSLPSITLSSSY